MAQKPAGPGWPNRLKASIGCPFLESVLGFSIPRLIMGKNTAKMAKVSARSGMRTIVSALCFFAGLSESKGSDFCDGAERIIANFRMSRVWAGVAGDSACFRFSVAGFSFPKRFTRSRLGSVAALFVRLHYFDMCF